MKPTHFYLCLTLLFCAQTTVFATPANDKITYRLEKSQSSGFTLLDNASSSQCILYPNGIIKVTKATAGLSSIKWDKLVLKGDLQATISAAAAGKIITNAYPADANSTSYIAYPEKFPPYVKLAPIILFEQNGGTGQENINDSSAARVLRNFIDVNCGTPPAASTITPTPQSGEPVDYSILMQFGKGWEYRYANTIWNNSEPTVIKNAETLSAKWKLWFDENQQDGTSSDGNGNVISRPVFPSIPTVDFSKEMLVVIIGAKTLSQITETNTSIDVTAVYHIPTGNDNLGCVELAVVMGPSLIVAKVANTSNKPVNFISTKVYVPCGKG